MLECSETALDMLDGQEHSYARSQRGVRFEVLPGRHMLGVSLFIVSPIPGGGVDFERSDEVAVLCFDALAGHTYFIGHHGRGKTWRPLITDGGSNADVPFAPCSPPATTSPGR